LRKGQLVLRAIPPDRLYPILRVLNANRALSSSREEINHLAPDGVLAWLIHTAVPLVAQSIELGRKRPQVDLLANAQPESGARNHIPRRHALDQGVRHSDDHACLAWSAEAAQRRHARAHSLAGRRRRLVRQAVPRRKQHDVELGREWPQYAREALRPELARGHMDHTLAPRLVCPVQQPNCKEPEHRWQGRIRSMGVIRTSDRSF
jgi:hypothetical protein